MKYSWLLLVVLILGLGCDNASISNLQKLAEEYPTVSPEQTKKTLDKLTVQDHWTMELVELGTAFKLAAFLKACNADSSITWHELSTGRQFNCFSGQAYWDESVRMVASVGVGTFLDNVESGRLEVIIYEKCRSGQIDKGSCNMFYGIQQNVADSSAQTNEVIIDNIGNKCRVGRDAGCYP